MSKANTSFFFIILLLCFALSYASRPAPAFHEASLNIDHHQDHVRESKQVANEESCNGGQDEECLERRNLAAHLDYIYTQNQNP
ncbi:phytosulfokines 2 precursor [Solanum lycopersicum]|uniref:Phytosulfokine n=1 Tax=Solanum lycopersicum TaxID=4081 RepID=Q7PCA8_SOLLC|nr:phytosulfokines 2 precursor [Solanum lycopersicum]DAA00285.1 TPA_exp: putative phytosulfokine peptide precursor [Solanum lycopersicum]